MEKDWNWEGKRWKGDNIEWKMRKKDEEKCENKGIGNGNGDDDGGF
nr:hypothetical protein [Siminovitchia fortis]